MIKLWNDNEVITLDNEKYLNEKASKKFYKVLKNWLDVESTDSYVLLDEAQNILEDLDERIFEEISNIFENNYSKDDIVSDKEAFECIKKIGVLLISNGYPKELITNRSLNEYGKKLSKKFNNFEFNDDFVYYEILLDGLKNNSVMKLMMQCEEIWGINLILKLCKKYDLSNKKIEPSLIDNWLYEHNYTNDRVKSERFLKAISEILISPDEYLCGKEITDFFCKKYDISSAIKHAMDDNRRVHIEDYTKKGYNQKSLSLSDAYNMVIELYAKKFSNLNKVDDSDLFKFINSIPNELKKIGISSELIRQFKIKDIEEKLSEKFSNFKFNEDDFELYLNVQGTKDLNELISNSNSIDEISSILNYCSKLGDNQLDFNNILIHCNDTMDLINFLHVNKDYINGFSNLSCENIDNWLEGKKSYELAKNTEGILYLFRELPKYVSTYYFYDKFDIEKALEDYSKGNIKPLISYDKSLNEHEIEKEEKEEVLTIIRRRPSTKVEKKSILIVGAGIISFLMVSFVTKKNPVAVAHNFQKIISASGLSDNVGDFGAYITCVVGVYYYMVGRKVKEEKVSEGKVIC